MTLYRQLVIFTFLLFFLLFSGTWLAKLESTRSFLIDQLESHSQDTATSLGLSVSQYVAEDDLPAAESMINAVFDRGYYRIVRFLDTDGEIQIERVHDVQIENVPQWFINMVPLKTPESTANVMSGWHQAGTIYVKSHPGFAYKTLWENAVRITLWFIACGITVIIAGGFGLRVLLEPLKRVEGQADALCRKKYEIQDRLPRTRELRRVVEAMNRMTNKVKEMFEEQVSIADGLRRHAYYDTLTGLGNRRYFESQINARLDRRDSETKGIVALVEIHNLMELNQEKGFQAGDELLKRAADLLRESTEQFVNCVLARLTGGDFGIFLPDAAPWEAETIAASLANKTSQLAVEELSLTDNVAHVGASTYDCTTTVGAATYDCSTTLEQLLSEADLALRTAQQAGPNGWEVRNITADSEDTPLGQQQWRAMLAQALQERRISLFGQPVVKSSDKEQIIHLEIFSRIIQENGNLLSAGLFMPFAERLKLVSNLDRIVLEKVMELDLSQMTVNSIAVNISPATLRDEVFRRWVSDSLRNHTDNKPRIIFEFAEFGAVQNLELVKEFSVMVRKKGHGLGLDHYGQSFSHLGYLQSLRPDYVKIDRAYTGELKDEANDSRFFIGSLCSVAHSLDIEVIAEGVETEHQWLMLSKLNIDAMQGYFIEKPGPVMVEAE
jgi:diguanylate cyclase (GGDEF)-like protein